MQLSYAQRLEDYHLACAFAGQETGCYIDIGGGHPVADNVSYWFYLKGWSGLVVEPQSDLLDLYAHLRPRDIAVGTLVGRHDGEADFYAVERLHGLSTTLPDNARTAVELGGKVNTVRMPMTTLAALLAKHEISQVDFLKVDVEGAEADVLAGADWSKFRPKILLVEAVAPGSMAQSWDDWEPALLANGYRFALEDGLNRFYVAQEAADIAGRLPREPVDWNSAGHLYDLGRAPEQPDHPDHGLARALVRGLLAELPRLDPDVLLRLLSRGAPVTEDGSAGIEKFQDLLFGKADFPGASPHARASGDRRETCRALMSSDRFRAALGRIAAAYDGGHVRDDV